MEFIIQRTSDCINDYETKPIRNDNRLYFKKLPKYRDYDEKRKVWFIKIDTLEELMQLYKEQGDLIICEDYLEKTPVIEIYDDWRE